MFAPPKCPIMQSIHYISILSERKLIARFIQRRVDSYSSPGRPSRGNANDTWTHDLFERNGDARDRLAGNPLAARLGETYEFVSSGQS